LIAAIWGLFVSLLTVVAFPYIRFVTLLQDPDVVSSRIVELGLANFILYGMLTYFGTCLASKSKFLFGGTQIIHLIEKWQVRMPEFLQLASTSCLYGLALGLFCKIFDGMFFGLLVGYEGRVDVSQVSFITRILFGFYQAVTSEIFGRFFALLFCMEALRQIKVIMEQKKNVLPPAVTKLYEKVAPLLTESEHGKHIDLPVIVCMVASSAFYVFWCLSWQLSVYPADGVFAFVLAFLRVVIMEGITGMIFAYLFIVEERIECCIISHIVKEIIVQI
jgi:hypothetical protein